jgi:hypothetical protein
VVTSLPAGSTVLGTTVHTESLLKLLNQATNSVWQCDPWKTNMFIQMGRSDTECALDAYKAYVLLGTWRVTVEQTFSGPSLHSYAQWCQLNNHIFTYLFVLYSTTLFQ